MNTASSGIYLQAPVAPKDYVYIPAPTESNPYYVIKEQVKSITFYNTNPETGWSVETESRSFNHTSWKRNIFPTHQEAIEEIVHNTHNLFRR